MVYVKTFLMAIDTCGLIFVLNCSTMWKSELVIMVGSEGEISAKIVEPLFFLNDDQRKGQLFVKYVKQHVISDTDVDHIDEAQRIGNL